MGTCSEEAKTALEVCVGGEGLYFVWGSHAHTSSTMFMQVYEKQS